MKKFEFEKRKRKIKTNQEKKTGLKSTQMNE